MPRLNLVHQFDWLPMGRNHVIPPSRNHQVRRQSQDPVSNRIAMMVVVEKPGVDVAFAQRRLDGGQVHGQTTILNKTSHLSESGKVCEVSRLSAGASLRPLRFKICSCEARLTQKSTRQNAERG